METDSQENNNNVDSIAEACNEIYHLFLIADEVCKSSDEFNASIVEEVDNITNEFLEIYEELQEDKENIEQFYQIVGCALGATPIDDSVIENEEDIDYSSAVTADDENQNGENEEEPK